MTIRWTGKGVSRNECNEFWGFLYERERDRAAVDRPLQYRDFVCANLFVLQRVAEDVDPYDIEILFF